MHSMASIQSGGKYVENFHTLVDYRITKAGCAYSTPVIHQSGTAFARKLNHFRLCDKQICCQRPGYRPDIEVRNDEWDVFGTGGWWDEATDLSDFRRSTQHECAGYS